MNPQPVTPLPERCDAIQSQLSEMADSGAALPPALEAHLNGCPACARFAAEWLQGPPAALSRSMPAAAIDPLRDRILDAAAQPNVIRFPAPIPGRPSWQTWLGRVAACLACVGLSYWLLQPAPSPVSERAEAPSAPTLTDSLVQMDNQSKREQTQVQKALVDGGRQVRGDVAWSVSALEL